MLIILQRIFVERPIGKLLDRENCCVLHIKMTFLNQCKLGFQLWWQVVLSHPTRIFSSQLTRGWWPGSMEECFIFFFSKLDNPNEEALPHLFCVLTGWTTILVFLREEEKRNFKMVPSRVSQVWDMSKLLIGSIWRKTAKVKPDREYNC